MMQDEPQMAPELQQQKPDVNRYKKWFDEARDVLEEARREAEIDRDYHDGKQWTPEEVAALKKRKQPVQTYNLIRVAINGMVGVIERMQTDPKALPRTQADDAAADVATQALRYVADQQRLDRLKVKAARSFFVEGVAAVLVGVEPAEPDFDVTIERIPWEHLFYDPFSREEDFSDARYLGIAKWVDRDWVEQMYPDAQIEIEAAFTSAGSPSETWSDRPHKGWADRRRRRLLLVEMYHKEATEWQRCLFTGGGVIEYGPSPYVCDRGRPTCPIVAVAFARDRENYVYGAVRDLRSPQDGYNKRQSKLLHMLNVRQTFGTRAAIGEDGVDKVKSELAKPDGHVEIMHGAFGQDFGIIPVSDQIAGQFQLLGEARAQMDRLLPNPGILGRGQENASGRAQLVQQQAGMTELADQFGALTDWETKVYRQVWARIKQFWTAARWIRTTDDIGAPQYLQVNVPVLDQMGFPQLNPQTGQPVMQNTLAELDVDITLEAVPESPTLAAEQFQLLSELAQRGLPIPPEILIEHSMLRNKPRILQAIQEMRQAQMQAQGQQAQVQAGKLQAETRARLADAQRTEIETGLLLGQAAPLGAPPPQVQ